MAATTVVDASDPQLVDEAALRGAVGAFVAPARLRGHPTTCSMPSRRRARSTWVSRVRSGVLPDVGVHAAGCRRGDKSISDLVNTAVRQNLAEDAEDLAAYRARAKEPSLDLEKVMKDLRRRGKL